MKITVNNKREKEIIETFTEFVADWIESKEMQGMITHADYEFQAHEIELISNGFRSMRLAVDKKEPSIWLESENITGICKYCGEQWQGVEDESELNIMDYEHFLNSDESYHMKCHEKQKEENK